MRNGSMVMMENVCQLRYLHSVPKESDVTEGRINLTFRCKSHGDEGTTAGELEHERRDHWINQISTEEGLSDSTAGAWRGGEESKASGNETDLMTGDGGQVFGDCVQFYDPKLHSSGGKAPVVEYVIKTNIGAECYCAAEVEEALDVERFYLLARPFGVAGYVAVCSFDGSGRAGGGAGADDELASQMEATLLQLRTAHHVLRYHDHFDLDEVLPPAPLLHDAAKEESGGAAEIGSITGEMLYEYYKAKLVASEADVPSLANLEEGGTFRTTCERIGSGHGFQAPEVERCGRLLISCVCLFFSSAHILCILLVWLHREIGGAMSEYYTHIKPKMNDFDIQVRIDVIGSKVIIGTQINVDDLSKERHFLRFRNAVTIKTNLAYAMIRCANINEGDLVVDVSTSNQHFACVKCHE